MKFQLNRMLFLGISMMFFSSIGFAEFMYVPDGEVLPLRTGPSRGHKIIMLVEAGQKIEILELGDDWSRVRLPNEKEGYLLTEYLITEERWHQIREAKRKMKEEIIKEKKRKAEAERKKQELIKRRKLEATVVDKASGAKFTMSIKLSYDCQARVIGEIPEHIDLANDTVAKKLLHKGYMYAKSNCPEDRRTNIAVNLRKADSEMSWLVGGKFDSLGKLSKWNYRNIAKELARKEREKAEEERKKAEAKKRLKNFEKQYGVTDWPVMKEFSVNPFIYEGKKVAFVSEFGTMLSATEGILECGGEFFIVSDIPKGFFRKEAEVVIAGRPLGKKETKLPLFGEVLVPNLKFVGAYLCEKQNCRDIIWK